MFSAGVEPVTEQTLASGFSVRDSGPVMVSSSAATMIC